MKKIVATAVILLVALILWRNLIFPQASTGHAGEWTPPQSTINLLVKIPVAPFAAQANQAIPRTLKADSDWSDDYIYTVTRGDIGLRMNGDRLETAVPITIKIEGRKYIWPIYHYRTCDDIHRRLTFYSRFHVDADWNLVSETTPPANEAEVICYFSWTGLDLGGIDEGQVDITSAVNDAAGAAIADAAREIDQMAPALLNKDSATRFWRQLQQPIAIGDGAWLSLNPEEVGVGTVSGNGDVATIPVSVRARPLVVIGDEPVEAARELLPLNQHDAKENRFHVVLPVEMGYDQIAGRLQSSIGKQEITVFGSAVTVEALSVVPAGEQLLVDVTYGGDFSGHFFLLGTPIVEDDAIRLQEVQYALGARDILFKVPAALVQNASGGWEESLSWDVSAELEEARKLLGEEGLNWRVNENMQLTGTVNTLEIEDLILQSDAMSLVVLATGEATVTVELQP